MNTPNKIITALTAALVGVLLVSSIALANGGPFLIKYPNGDPAARGIPARLDPSLKPTREERLRVVKEDLTITFVVDPTYSNRPESSGLAPGPRKPAPTPKIAPATPPVAAANKPEAPVAAQAQIGAAGSDLKNPASLPPPLAVVTAAYTIENPTAEAVEVDFGFPILRGIYISPFSMMPSPDVRVQLDREHLSSEIISNSHIYGIIRQQARDVIEKAIASDAELARLVATVRATNMVRQRAREAVRQAVGNDRALSEAVAKDRQLAALAASPADNVNAEHEAARTALADYMARKMRWTQADLALMVEFVSLDFRAPGSDPRDRSHFAWGSRGELVTANLGPLSAIGEQKATQFFAKLAAGFDPAVTTAYEDIFSAWGGDVRERSLDLKTGQIRPREITVTGEELAERRPSRFDAIAHDPTIYARVDYLDPKARLTEQEKASCQAVLKNLPVVFTFAPMNLVYYRAKFPANSTRTLTVSYKQFAYADTHEPGSYQLAYVVHPASMWKNFGPINLEVAVPENVPVRASTAIQPAGVEDRKPSEEMLMPRSDQKKRFAIHRATVADKTGELYIAIDSDAWSKVTNESLAPKQASR